jgi:ubiquitin thioesterase OTU1
MGSGVLELNDDATVQMLFEALKAKLSIDNFTIKYGPPTKMRTISLEHGVVAARSLGLHGETLTIVPTESSADFSATNPVTRDTAVAGDTSDEVILPWPEREGSLCKSSTSLSCWLSPCIDRV